MKACQLGLCEVTFRNAEQGSDFAL